MALQASATPAAQAAPRYHPRRDVGLGRDQAFASNSNCPVNTCAISASTAMKRAWYCNSQEPATKAAAASAPAQELGMRFSHQQVDPDDHQRGQREERHPVLEQIGGRLKERVAHALELLDARIAAQVDDVAPGPGPHLVDEGQRKDWLSLITTARPTRK